MLPLPVVLTLSAFQPSAVLLEPVVLIKSAATPVAVLASRTLAERARAPVAVLPGHRCC